MENDQFCEQKSLTPFLTSFYGFVSFSHAMKCNLNSVIYTLHYYFGRNIRIICLRAEELF